MSADNALGCDIAVVGLGIAGAHQLTRQVEETIRRCTKLFVTDTGTGLLDYVADLGPDASSTSAPRPRPWSTASSPTAGWRAEVVSAALEQPPVCFATYGHPTMYCYPTTLIQRAALVLDLKVKVLPGVSFLDTLLSDLGMDPGFDGLQLYEATDLLVRRRPLQPDVSAVITQAPMVANAYNRPAERRLDHLQLLQQYFAETYPITHEIVLVTSAPHPLLDPEINVVPLGSLAAALLAASQLCTLYIPPVSHRPVADEAMAAVMQLAPQGEEEEEKASPAARPGRPGIRAAPGQVMTTPTYVIAATPRSGSSLLAEGLEATGVVGRPAEYFSRRTSPGCGRTTGRSARTAPGASTSAAPWPMPRPRTACVVSSCTGSRCGGWRAPSASTETPTRSSRRCSPARCSSTSSVATGAPRPSHSSGPCPATSGAASPARGTAMSSWRP